MVYVSICVDSSCVCVLMLIMVFKYRKNLCGEIDRKTFQLLGGVCIVEALFRGR